MEGSVWGDKITFLPQNAMLPPNLPQIEDEKGATAPVPKADDSTPHSPSVEHDGAKLPSPEKNVAQVSSSVEDTKILALQQGDGANLSEQDDKATAGQGAAALTPGSKKDDSVCE